MKISKIEFNNRRKVFTVHTRSAVYDFPYAKTRPEPVRGNYVRKACVDKEMNKEGFSYVLENGEEGAVHMDSVLEHNQDPEHMKDLLLYNLTLALRKAVEESGISKRELIRQLNTSPSQYYRMLNPTNTSKSVAQMIKLLYSLDCDLEFVIKREHGKILHSTAVSVREMSTA